MTSPNTLSYYMSLFTILVCCISKVPQIINVYDKQSTVGINHCAVFLEFVSYNVTALYNYVNKYSLITYLEYPIIIAQQIALIYFLLKLKDQHTSPETRYGIITYVLVVLGFMSKLIPPKLLDVLVPFCTPISGISKCAYIYGIVKDESAETISLTTWYISVVSNLFRIITVAMDSGDFNLLTNFSISTLLSCGVLFTAIHYKKKAENRYQD